MLTRKRNVFAGLLGSLRAGPRGGDRRRSRSPRPRASLPGLSAPSSRQVADDQRYRVVGALEADRRVGDVVEDDQVGALALELAAGPADGVSPVFGGEADDGLVLGAASPRSLARMSSVGYFGRFRLDAVLALQLAGGSARYGSRRARRPSAARAGSSNRSTVFVGPTRPWSRRRYRFTPGGSGRETLAAIRVTSAPRRCDGGREGDPHPPARAVTHEAHRVDRLAGAAGGHHHPQPVPRPALAVRPGQRRLLTATVGAPRCPSSSRVPSAGSGNCSLPDSTSSIRASSRSESGSRPRPSLAARGEQALARARSPPPPRSRSVARLAWVAGVGVHAVVHRRGNQAAAPGGRGRSVVSIESAKPAASFAIVLAEAGTTRKASQLAASSRWPIGSWTPPDSPLAGEVAAHRVALVLGGEHRRADDPLEGGRRRRSGPAFSVITTRTPCPASVARRANSSDL